MPSPSLACELAAIREECRRVQRTCNNLFGTTAGRFSLLAEQIDRLAAVVQALLDREKAEGHA